MIVLIYIYFFSYIMILFVKGRVICIDQFEPSGYRPNSMPSRLGCRTFEGNGSNGLADTGRWWLSSGLSSAASDSREGVDRGSPVEHSDEDPSANESVNRWGSGSTGGEDLGSTTNGSPKTSKSSIKSGSRSPESSTDVFPGDVITDAPSPLHIRFNTSELARNISARLTSSSSSSSRTSRTSRARQYRSSTSPVCPASSAPSSVRFLSQSSHASSSLPLADRSLEQSDAGSSQSSVEVDEVDEDDDTVRISPTLGSETQKQTKYIYTDKSG